MVQYNKFITIKFTYNTNTFSIKVNIKKNMATRRKEFSSIKEALDGSLYKQYRTTTDKEVFLYKFKYCDTSVFDFFNNARDAEKSGLAITHSVEQDDGTFIDYDVLINKFTYDERTITNLTAQKIYQDLSVEVAAT